MSCATATRANMCSASKWFLPPGEIWNGLTALRKNNTGYDLKQLFLGAEGTLGIITAVVLKLWPRPRTRATAFVALRDLPAAIALLNHLQSATGNGVSAFELVPANRYRLPSPGMCRARAIRLASAPIGTC